MRGRAYVKFMEMVARILPVSIVMEDVTGEEQPLTPTVNGEISTSDANTQAQLSEVIDLLKVAIAHLSVITGDAISIGEEEGV